MSEALPESASVPYGWCAKVVATSAALGLAVTNLTASSAPPLDIFRFPMGSAIYDVPVFGSTNCDVLTADVSVADPPVIREPFVLRGPNEPIRFYAHVDYDALPHSPDNPCFNTVPKDMDGIRVVYLAIAGAAISAA